MNILEQIIADKRKEIAARKEAVPVDLLLDQMIDRQMAPAFIASLRQAPIGLIAEVKHKSPSAGVIRDPFDPATIAQTYEAAGAQAVSVLVDTPYFGGGEDYFRQVRNAVALPLLYKEFVVDKWQIIHAAALGASAVLLIAAVLEKETMSTLLTCCEEYGLTALVEVHNKNELDSLQGLPITCLGINNRDLKVFKTSIETTFSLMEHAPEGAFIISESGIKTPDDVYSLKEAGVGGILVGESLLRQQDLRAAIQELMGKVWGEG